MRFQDYRQHVDELYAAALTAVEPQAAVQRQLRREGSILHVADLTFDLDNGRVFVISVGKAAVPMALAAVETLGDTLSAAVVISKSGTTSPGAVLLAERSNVQLLSGSHPVSGPDSVAATAVAIEIARKAGPEDLVLCLISGGASALLTQPVIPLADWQALLSALLTSGCTINELNMVRRQLDRVKGGGLAQLAAPARCISLILSDVVGNPLGVIGSGPTIHTQESAQDALDVLERFDIAARLPKTTYFRIEQALREMEATAVALPEANAACIVGDVRQAALAALAKAVQLGFVSQLLTVHLEGEAREVGRVVGALAKDTSPGRCLILGGETTVTVQGEGQGGRNQELALAAALTLEDWEHVAVASLASDGEDGPTPAAGAVITGQTALTARALDLPPEPFLAANDSFTFFQRLDAAAAQSQPTASPSLVTIGSTGTNVNDLVFILTYRHLPANGGAKPVDNQTPIEEDI